MDVFEVQAQEQLIPVLEMRAPSYHRIVGQELFSNVIRVRQTYVGACERSEWEQRMA